MKTVPVAAIAVLSVLAFSASLAVEGSAVGIVDVSRVVRAHPEAKEADALLEKQLSELEAHKDAMTAEHDKLKKEFERARDAALSKAISETEKESRMEEAQKKIVELSEYAQKMRQTLTDEKRDLADRKVRMQRRLVEGIREVVAGLAREKGIDIVLDSSGVALSGVESVLYSSDRVDLTDAVIAAIAGGKAGQAGDTETVQP